MPVEILVGATGVLLPFRPVRAPRSGSIMIAIPVAHKPTLDPHEMRILIECPATCLRSGCYSDKDGHHRAGCDRHFTDLGVAVLLWNREKGQVTSLGCEWTDQS